MTPQVIIFVGFALVVLAALWARRVGARADVSPAPEDQASEAAEAEGGPRESQRRREYAAVVAGGHDPLEDVPAVGDEEEDDRDITAVALPSLQSHSYEDEEDDDSSDEFGVDDETSTGSESAVVPILFDEDAALDEPTMASDVFTVRASGATDTGRQRRRNEDAFLVLDAPPVFAVADGMGGYAGGDIASKLAIDTIRRAFDTPPANEGLFPHLPRRASELAQAILMANLNIWEKANTDADLDGMGTTFVAARFSPRKERVYIAHVGDSRCYLYREGALEQVTTDHTLSEQGIRGPMATNLTRALGIGPTVEVDIILGRPRSGDRYLICSDGLSKMLSDERIATLLAEHQNPDDAVPTLVEAANQAGGKDNITVVLIAIEAPELQRSHVGTSGPSGHPDPHDAARA